MRTANEMGGQSADECEREGRKDNESTDYGWRECKDTNQQKLLLWPSHRGSS